MPLPPEKNPTDINNPSLKILMIAPTSFFNDYGGHIRILEETLALQALGHEVVIVTYYKGKPVPGLNIQRTWPLPWRADYEVGSSRHKIAFDVYLAARAIQVGRRMKPDIIHGHMHEGALIGGILARMLRKPLVFDFQGSLAGEMVDHQFLNPSGFYYPLVRRMEGIIDRLPGGILTSSLRAKKLLTEEFGVRDEIITTLPDCVDTERFDPAKFTQEDRDGLKFTFGIHPGRPIVAYLGLLADYQGLPQLLEASAYLKNQGSRIHFLIMGYPKVELYQALADELGVTDQVTFTGRVKYIDAPRHLAVGDLAVSPKVSATEGSGKVLNYMAMCLPTIASDTPVHREYLDDLGIYLPPGDVIGLAEAIARYVDDPDTSNCLGKKLRQRAVNHYDWKKAGQTISLTYQRLLNSRLGRDEAASTENI